MGYLQMGYGSRALELLCSYYEGKMTNLAETEKESRPEVENVSQEVSYDVTGSVCDVIKQELQLRHKADNNLFLF